MSETPQYGDQKTNAESEQINEVTHDNITDPDLRMEKSPEELETEKAAMKKVTAIGLEKNLMAHGTKKEFLDLIAHYGLIALEPKFQNRWKKYPDFRLKRMLAAANFGGSTGATSEAVQGEQSISLNDPWCGIEISEALSQGQDYHFYSVPIRPKKMGEPGKNVRINESREIDIKNEIIDTIPCEIENMESVSVPYDTSPGRAYSVVHGNFKVSNETLKFLQLNRDDLKNVQGEIEQTLNQNIEKNPSLKDFQFSHIPGDSTFFLRDEIHPDKTLNRLKDMTGKRFIRLYFARMADTKISEGEKKILQQIYSIHKKQLKPIEETRWDSSEQEEMLIRSLTGGFMAEGGALLIRPTKDDLKTGKVIRSQSGIIQKMNTESAWESRVPLNRIIGISYSKRGEGTNRSTFSLEECIEFAKRVNIPVYDENGDLAWPKQMTYEEVKQFVAERDTKKAKK